MVKIYALVSGEEVLYVGQTVRTLEERAWGHRKSSNRCNSKNIPTDMQWEMQLLEECEGENATARERHFIETLKPLYNKRIPGRTMHEYSQTEAGKAAKKAVNKAYKQTEAGKAVQKESAHRYRLKKKAQQDVDAHTS